MDEVIDQGSELMIGIAVAAVVIGAVMLLLGKTDAGILRMYITCILEAAC